MQSWWRVLRGVWPYRWSVVLSLVCALGVGLSYASGVAVLLPVTKIFISTEGVHGWANRTASEKRLDVQVLDLDTTIREGQKPGKAPRAVAPVIVSAGTNAPEILQSAGPGDRMTRVRNLDARAEALGPRDSRNWQDILSIIALAAPDDRLEIELTRQKTGDTVLATVPAAHLAWYTRGFVLLVGVLPNDSWQALLYVVVLFNLLCVVGSIFRYYQQFIGMSVANRVVMDIRRGMYDRVVQLPASYFAQKGTSDVMSRLTQDTNTLTEGVSMALGKAIQEPIKAVFAFGLAWVIDWRLTLGVVLIMPVLGIIIRKFSKRMRRAARGALENWACMLAIINETLMGARVVKAYSAEGYERRRFARVNKDLLSEQIKLNHYASLSRPTIETLAVALISIPMMWAAYYVLKGTLDRENFITLLACFAAMIEPLRKLADVNSKVQQTNAAATRVFEVADMEPEPNHSHNLPKLPRHNQSITFEHIVFHYPGHEQTVLQDISFTVPRGKTVAVVGGNGSGKTTLLTLVPRLYVPTSGRVLIDGVDIAGVSLRSLRKQIGLVTQDTVLFADSIFNNIAYGTRHATPAQVLEASKRAYADEFVQSLPEGYDTKVGEHGVRLSGGQKQRLAIARAILHDPAILILDEAMSQIDSDSEMKISLALRDFTKDRTTFMIAHRFQTVISADVIVCLDAGKVVGIGQHHELLAACAAYRKLYENQFKEVA
jgi:ABC-type multidrug transport system fused ATPase/permease subunit